MQAEDMLGWHPAVLCDDGAFTECFVFLQDERTALGTLARVSKELAAQLDMQEGRWAFELKRYSGELHRYFYEPTLTSDEAQRMAADAISQMIRNNETVH